MCVVRICCCEFLCRRTEHTAFLQLQSRSSGSSLGAKGRAVTPERGAKSRASSASRHSDKSWDRTGPALDNGPEGGTWGTGSCEAGDVVFAERLDRACPAASARGTLATAQEEARARHFSSARARHPTGPPLNRALDNTPRRSHFPQERRRLLTVLGPRCEGGSDAGAG